MSRFLLEDGNEEYRNDIPVRNMPTQVYIHESVHPLCSSALPSATNCCSPSCCSVDFEYALGELAHFGPPKWHPHAIDANVRDFNAETSAKLFRLCCKTCNGRHGKKSAVVVTALFIAKNGLPWPEVNLPNTDGLWSSKGSRAPWEIGGGYKRGFMHIPKPTAAGG